MAKPKPIFFKILCASFLQGVSVNVLYGPVGSHLQGWKQETIKTKKKHFRQYFILVRYKANSLLNGCPKSLAYSHIDSRYIEMDKTFWTHGMIYSCLNIKTTLLHALRYPVSSWSVDYWSTLNAKKKSLILT